MAKLQEAHVGFSPTHPVPDCEYLMERAEAELRLAEGAANLRAAEAHRALARAYLGRIFSEDRTEPDLWRWLRAGREKRQALRSIFRSGSAPLARPPAAPSDQSFCDLLRSLEENLGPVDHAL